MRAIDWSSKALDDFDQTISFIAERNPSGARRTAARIDQTIARLARQPTGRRGRVEGTFEKVVRGLPWIVAYAIDRQDDGSERLIVLRVIHGARQWPAGTWPSV